MTRFTKTALAALFLGLSLSASPAIAQDRTKSLTVDTSTADFNPLHGGPIEIAVLSGNPQTGPSSILLKFPPNYPGGMHYHTNSYDAIILSGASKHWVKGKSGKRAKTLRPGDYFFQPGGEKEIHQDSFPSDMETVVFLRFDGPVDSFQHGKADKK